MRTKTVVVIVAIIAGIILFSILFINTQKPVETPNLPAGTHAVTIKEVIQTTKYTYFRVDENGNEYWIAVTKREAREGDVVYYSNPLEMNNFVSKELGRTFPAIFFVQNISNTPVGIETVTPSDMGATKKEIPKKDNIHINPVKGGIALRELFGSQDTYEGKTVKVRGVVTNYNRLVMGKNWAHIQDGTEYEGQFDLTVTTMDSVSVGNTVTFTGAIHLNKDFGSGYFYKVIMEDAKASNTKPEE